MTRCWWNPCGLSRGEIVFSQTPLKLFGSTQEYVGSALEYIIFLRGIKVYMPTGFGIIEITDKALEVALIFGKLDVKLMGRVA